jgi:HlyD family secretion protein
MKKLYWIIIIGIVLIIVIVSAQVMRGTAPIEVYTEKSSVRNIVEVVSATGKIQPETELKLSSDVSGEITEMMVKEGDSVRKGTLLCRIKPDLYMSAIDRVNATVNTTKANLGTAKAQLAQAKANLLNAETNFNRNKKLFEQNTISQMDFDASKAAYESAKANVDALNEGVNAGEYNIQSTEASLREANTNLEKTFIYAPVDGTISKLSVEKGERVVGVSGMQGTEILRLANLNEMEVTVEVNENDIIKVHLHDTALIEVDAYLEKKFKGIVTEIANSSNTSGTSIDQVTNFVVKIRLLRESYQYLINSKNPVPFRPGMSASVDIQTTRVSNVMSIPIQAVTTRAKDTLRDKGEEGGRREKVRDEKEEKAKKKAETKLDEIIFVLVDGVAKQRIVTTGIQDNDFIEIKSGVEKGDEIISGPYSAVSKVLKDKSKVKLVKKEDLYKMEN